MRIALYSPYLDTFGGGEKYMMTIAEVLSSENNVEVFLNQHLNGLGGDYLKNELSKRFDIDLKKVNFVNAPVGKNSSLISRMFFLKNYDFLFYLTDGSIFFPTSKKNILHIQSPLVGQPAKSLWGKLKLKWWNLIVYNSAFTRDHSKSNWPILSKVIYPPVNTMEIEPLKKKNYILSVGRFFGYLKDKKQGVMISAFKSLLKNKELNNWSLHLAGSASSGDDAYLRGLKQLSKGFHINFYPNIKYDKLMKLYGESSIYWHAAGFGENEPAKMEHFGISTVEAMAGGCVPVVINKGGQTEIVEDGKNGFLWNSLKDLEKLTVLLIKDLDLRTKLSKNALLASQKFSKDKFETEIKNLIKCTS